MSAALESLWGERLGHTALQAELDRLGRDTRNPALLADLFAALGDDPGRIAECLARPLLAERRLRARFAGDDTLHEPIRAQARADLARVASAADLAGLRGYYEETWVVADGMGGHREAQLFEADEWSRATAELGQLTDAPGRPRPGAVSGLQESSDAFWAVGILETNRERIRLGRVTWPKTDFHAWWVVERERHLRRTEDASEEGDYRLPALREGGIPDTWMPTPALPRVSRDVEAVWTGAELLVFGGSSAFSRGGRYDPALDLWFPLSVVGEPARRRDHTALWTGTEMIVWGGWGFDSTTNMLADGARYDPVTDAWMPLAQIGAPSPRGLHTAVWTGSEMIVWGGCPHFQCFSALGDGARYDPAGDSWSPVQSIGAPSARGQHVAVWTGDDMLVWGGNSGDVTPDPLDTGGVYDPVADTWRSTPLVGAPLERRNHTAVWSGAEMIVWGGQGPAGFLSSGARYDPVADSWSATSQVDAPVERRRHTAVWTGEEMIVWGGCRDSECTQHQGNGGRYDPVGDSWSPVSQVGDPAGRSQHAAVWTGQEMLLWGGCSGGECQISRQDGGRYSPATDSWVPMGNPGTPTARLNHTAIWTGAEMIVWGGHAEGIGPVLTGGRYDPATDSWSPTPVDGTANARDLHTAIWTGTEMIVWGGRIAGIGTSPIGARYDVAAGAWASTTTQGAPEGRAYHTAVWTGTEMLVWGGCRFSDCQSFLDSGGRYRPATDEWLPMAETGAPSPRFLHTGVEADGALLVWGGRDLGGALADGGRYDATLDLWTPLSTSGAPAARSGHTAVWGGQEMIVWGGDDGVDALGSGGRYSPGSDQWEPTALGAAPEPRTGHVAIWDGTGMVVWGGCDVPGCTAFQGDQFFTTGSRLDPARAVWTPTVLNFAPLGRALGTAVWSGEHMLVWGGWRGSSAEITHTGGLYRPNTSALIFEDGFESGDTDAWSMAVQ